MPQIISPYSRIVLNSYGPSPLTFIEMAARISHRSEESVTHNSWNRFIRSVVMEHGDMSVVEHVSVTVEFLVDRGISHELVRHRLASFTQESTRFVNYEKKMPPSFVYPIPEITCINSDHEIPDHADCPYDPAWLYHIRQCEATYKSLVRTGWRPQEARSVLPNALATKLWMTCNLRQWRHFFLMRTTKESHPQMKQVTVPLLQEFQSSIPILFDDIMPGSRQSDSMAKLR